jgi:hypothetical protein
MYLYPAYVEGWNVETSHPIEENEEEPICPLCLNAVAPIVAFAADMESVAHQHSFTDGNGNQHIIVVRQIIAP